MNAAFFENPVNCILVAIMLLSAIVGVRSGFIRSLLQFVQTALAVMMAFFLYEYPAVMLSDYFPQLGAWNLVISFGVTALAFYILYGMLFSLVKRGIGEKMHQHWFNRFAGIIPGLAFGFCIVFTTARLLQYSALPEVYDAARQSSFVTAVTPHADWLEDRLLAAVNRQQELLKKPTPALPSYKNAVFQTSRFTDRPDLEAQMLELVNAERVSRGLNALQADPEIAVVGRAHGADMFIRGYFAHETPEGADPFVRLQRGHVKYWAAGENLALSQSMQRAHNGLMNSPGHRANLLNPSYGRLGISILDGGDAGFMITQEFRN